MKKYGKIKIRHLINLEEKDGLQKSLNRLNKRKHYLKSKLGRFEEDSRQIKYINFHIKRLRRKAA